MGENMISPLPLCPSQIELLAQIFPQDLGKFLSFSSYLLSFSFYLLVFIF